MPLGVSQEVLRELGEVAQLHRWHLRFDGGPSAATPPPADEVNLLCQSAEVPRMESGEQTTINIRQHQIMRPGIRKFSHTINLTFIEVEDNTISTWLRDWRLAVFDPITGNQMPLEEIQADVVLTRLDKQDNGIWEYKMYGCYHNGGEPTGGELGSDEEILRPTLELYYDSFEEGPVGSF